MTKYIIRPAILVALVIAWSCSKDETQKTTFEVKAAFSFTRIDVWPERYKIILGAFGSDTINPLIFSDVTKQQEGAPVNLALQNVPEEAATIRLCIATQSGRVMYTLFKYSIKEPSQVVNIPASEVRLLSFGRVQGMVLNGCLACHGGSSGTPAAGLNLLPDRSHEALVDQPSVHSSRKLVDPGNAGNSFLIDVLRKRNLTFDHSASDAVPEEDIVLTEQWIKAGATDN